jgi:hypothetical protein
VSDLDSCRWALKDGGVPFREGLGDCTAVAQAHACGVVLEFPPLNDPLRFNTTAIRGLAVARS